MQDSNTNNNENITPYRATGNLNTTIGIPQIDVNNAMDVNIQSVNTNSSLNNGINNNLENNVNNSLDNLSSNGVENNNSSDIVSDTYIDNKDKKKKVTFNLEPKFKIILLILVIFLVFIFLLPVITSMFND